MPSVSERREVKKTTHISVNGGFLLKTKSAETVALWLFDEQIGVYPGCALSDASLSDYVMVIGRGGQITRGKFGNALEPIEPAPIEIPSGSVLFGLRAVEKPENRTVEPMTWDNANFCALMTSGEHHLRKEAGFANATQTKLNLGAFDWTVEFWFMPTRQTSSEGVIFEIGQGPRGENDDVTRLVLNTDRAGFTLYNQPSGTLLIIPSDAKVLNRQSSKWHHLAFVYSSAERQLRHYVDGILYPLPEKCGLKALDYGEEAYFSVGRDGLWKRPLPGRLDELRFSEAQIYKAPFIPPGIFAKEHLGTRPKIALKAGPPLLFDKDAKKNISVPLDSRKYLFIDDAIAAEMENITFTPNPPRKKESVLENIGGHLCIIADEDGLIRLYYGTKGGLAVLTSADGVTWKEPDLGPEEYRGARNIVIRDRVGLGTVFIDPNAPEAERWKYVSGIKGRGIFVYSSPGGWSFERQKTAALPFSAGSQSSVFYDDQRQLYVGYHRSDFGATPDGHTQREFVLTEVKDILKPWPFEPVFEEREIEVAKTKRLHAIHPWYLDNGPLTPGGFGAEFPAVFTPDDSLDPLATDIYVAKALKYPWAPDTYLAFPVVYFHYDEGPETRRILRQEERQRGSGPTETQLAVSRDGINWKRYPRPTYIGIGKHGGFDIHMAYIVQGMVKRGEEIWQYYLGSCGYHSSWSKDKRRSLFRIVQRFDGFVSADTPYTGGMLKTKPLKFKGNRLVLNIDTDATGYAQVGFLDANGNPIEGYSVDDCIYINGDFIETEVEWIDKEIDLSPLEGKVVRVVFRMRGAKLYSMQFVQR